MKRSNNWSSLHTSNVIADQDREQTAIQATKVVLLTNGGHQGLGIQFSGRSLAQQAQGPGFRPQLLKNKKTKKQMVGTTDLCRLYLQSWP